MHMPIAGFLSRRNPLSDKEQEATLLSMQPVDPFQSNIRN